MRFDELRKIVEWVIPLIFALAGALVLASPYIEPIVRSLLGLSDGEDISKLEFTAFFLGTILVLVSPILAFALKTAPKQGGPPERAEGSKDGAAPSGRRLPDWSCTPGDAVQVCTLQGGVYEKFYRNCLGAESLTRTGKPRFQIDMAAPSLWGTFRPQNFNAGTSRTDPQSKLEEIGERLEKYLNDREYTRDFLLEGDIWPRIRELVQTSKKNHTGVEFTFRILLLRPDAGQLEATFEGQQEFEAEENRDARIETFFSLYVIWNLLLQHSDDRGARFYFNVRLLNDDHLLRSLYRVNDDALVVWHHYDGRASGAPCAHIRKLETSGRFSLFRKYVESEFDDLFDHNALYCPIDEARDAGGQASFADLVGRVNRELPS